MGQPNPENITFQITVAHLKVSSRLPKEDIRVTVTVNGVSKMTCSGKLSWRRLKVKWKHPFLFTAPPEASVGIDVYTLPNKLTPKWDKQPLGDKMVTNVLSLLESGNEWECDVSGLSSGPATLSLINMACDALASPDKHNCLSALRKYKERLYDFGTQFRNVAAMTTSIEVNLARLDLCSVGHPDHTNILKDLGVAFSRRYIHGGNMSDLHKAIEKEQYRLDLCPSGHPEHGNAIGELAIDLWKHYCIQKNKTDLDRLIDMEERWVELCPDGHLDHGRALGELALSLQERYFIQGDVADLDKAIKMREKRLDLAPPGHVEHGVALGNLAVSLTARYHKNGNLTDLERTIDLEEKRLDVHSSNHPLHGQAIWNLAISLQNRYHKLNNHSDLIRAIKLHREAAATFPAQHPEFAPAINQLAATTLLLSQSSYSDQPLPSPDEAFETYRLLKNCGPAVSLALWNATQDWVKYAEEYSHPSVLEAYQTSLNTLDHFTSFTSSLDSRHETMQARVADVANDAFSCAIRHNELQMAVELLEQGRGILWNQLARFDIPLAVLEGRDQQARNLGREFAQLSADLREHAQGKGTGHYWRVREEWQSVVDKIRRLDGFSRFLLPPHFEHLQQAAEDGPVIIVNASKYDCDALIVLPTGPPVHVPLPCSLADVIQLCSQLSELTQDPHAYGNNRESWVRQMLRELWSSVVEPIATALQDDVRLPPGSHIWWCPTSKFTVLPFHAAGPYLKGTKSLLDTYVSSYAPSLSALIRSRDRIQGQRKAGEASGTANAISFVAVGQGKPSTDTGLSDLPEVELEIDKIRNKTGMPPHMTFETVTGEAATIEGTVQAFRNHRWVHVACHGAQHPERPFESWFAMGDGKLTLMRIIQERYTNSEFAFLSACHTASGDESTPDEVLHLAAGMQFAGFNGVIGTLWKVDDSVAHQVVTQFYAGMFKHPVIDFARAAVALNTAVIETAEDVSLEKRIVFVHIGI